MIIVKRFLSNYFLWTLIFVCEFEKFQYHRVELSEKKNTIAGKVLYACVDKKIKNWRIIDSRLLYEFIMYDIESMYKRNVPKRDPNLKVKGKGDKKSQIN